MALALLVAGCQGTSPSTSEVTAAPVAFEVLEDVAYSENPFRHILDIYRPENTGAPVPTIVAIHGGGFRENSKDMYRRIGRHYAESGVAFVAINYRLTPDHGGYPVQIQDSFCALAWVHQHAADYGFDPDRIIVWGGSAGGYLASMVATVDDPSDYLEGCPNDDPPGDAVHAAVVLYGLYDFTTVDDYPPSDVDGHLELYWGAPYENLPIERLEEMSPIAQIDGDEPPFLILHGTADTEIPSVMSERFAASLEQAGVEVELVLMPGVGHAFELGPLTSDEMALTFREVDEFLERTLDP